MKIEIHIKNSETHNFVAFVINANVNKIQHDSVLKKLVIETDKEGIYSQWSNTGEKIEDYNVSTRVYRYAIYDVTSFEIWNK